MFLWKYDKGFTWKKLGLPENERGLLYSWPPQEENNSGLLVVDWLSIVLVFVHRKYTLRQLERVVPLSLAKLDAVLCFSGAHLHKREKKSLILYQYIFGRDLAECGWDVREIMVIGTAYRYGILTGLLGREGSESRCWLSLADLAWACL